MRILWVTPSLPHPQGTGGCVHEYELIRALAPRHDLQVVTSDPVGSLTEAPLLAAGASFTRVGWRPRPYPTKRGPLAASLLVARPDLITWLKRDRLALLAEGMRTIDEARPVDAVQITLGEIAPLVGVLDRPTGLYLFDSLTREVERHLQADQPPLRRAQRLVERRRTERFERRWYRRADALAAVSAVDAAWLEAHVGRPVEVIENSVPESCFEAPDRQRSSAIVTFVGTLNHPPNTDAIEWLVGEIWPLIRAEQPQAELRIVGRGDTAGTVTARIAALVESVGGLLFADVEDVRPYYWESAVVVAPIRLGAGMRSKVIHALACGTPVVATPTALEGLAPAVSGAVLVGSTAASVAQRVVQVLAEGAAAVDRVEAVRTPVKKLGSAEVALGLERWWRWFAGVPQPSSPTVP